MRLSLYEHPAGVELEGGVAVAYDVAADDARLAPARIDGRAFVWWLGADPPADDVIPALSADVELGPGAWVLRCDRVDFPPGGVAYRHVHPGPGIRRLLFGELTIDSAEGTHTHRAGDSWFEGADFPVLATASADEDSAFVRVLLLPAGWAGRRTIRYLDPADEARPKLQRATVLLEEPLG